MNDTAEADMEAIDEVQQSEDYRRVEKAIAFIEQNFKSRPTLEQIAQSVHLSQYHFDRMFKRWAGISPTQFMRFLTLDYTKGKLADAASILDTALDAGLSGPGRLHDLFITFDAMSPGEFKRQGAGVRIRYGFGPSPFGNCLMALTARGICYLGFHGCGETPGGLDQLRRQWPKANLIEDHARIHSIAARIFSGHRQSPGQPFHLLVKGTNFQINVWRALLRIPPGSIVSYQNIAACIGRPRAFRAVANAVAANPVAYLIPCHRVITQSGRINKYRWGAHRKKAILGWEAAGAEGRKPW